MEHQIIKQAIDCGLITFETLCGSWYWQYQRSGKIKTIPSDLLRTVLEHKYEWINQHLDFQFNFNFQYEKFIGESPLQKKLDILQFCDLSNISLLGLAIAWEDTMAQETLLQLKSDEKRVAVLRYKKIAFVSATDLKKINSFPIHEAGEEAFAQKVKEILDKNQPF